MKMVVACRGGVVAFLIWLAASIPAAAQPTIVVLGSSTAVGSGASTPDSSWVGRYRRAVVNQIPTAEVVNLAISGFTTYDIMPTGYVPPPDRPSPSLWFNITAALALDPDAIIVNMPANDIAHGFGVDEVLRNYAVVVGEAGAVPVWITTSQPRNLDDAGRQQLRAINDSTYAIYGEFAIDSWTVLAAPDGTIEPAYDSGDGIHFNDAGHAIIAARALAKGIPGVLTGGADGGREPSLPPLRGEIRLEPNAPNPFNPSTRLAFDLGHDGAISLVVHDLAGHHVRQLVDGALLAGRHQVTWDGRDDGGRPVASGTYVYRLETADGAVSRRMILAR